MVFVTWRLAGSITPPSLDILTAENTGPPRFRQRDEQLDRLRSGPVWRQDPRIALPDIMRWLKGRTSRVANRIVGRTGKPFWQDEAFDHWVRSAEELQELIGYVEGNPVKARLVEAEEEWPWSRAQVRADDKRRSSALQMYKLRRQAEACPTGSRAAPAPAGWRSASSAARGGRRSPAPAAR